MTRPTIQESPGYLVFAPSNQKIEKKQKAASFGWKLEGAKTETGRFLKPLLIFAPELIRDFRPSIFSFRGENDLLNPTSISRKSSRT